jgi:hypothetical protein
MTTQIVADSAPVRNQLLYILKSGSGLIKVGISYDPESRRRALMTGHPFKLEVAYVVEFEENLAASVEELTKSILRYCQKQGEWFDISVDGAVEAVKEARRVYDFCRKRIPSFIVEKLVECEVERIVTPRKYVGHERAFDAYLSLYCKIFETFFVVKCITILGAIVIAIEALGAIVDINSYGFFEFVRLASSTALRTNSFNLEFASMIATPAYAAMVVSIIVMDRRKRAELAMRP